MTPEICHQLRQVLDDAVRSAGELSAALAAMSPEQPFPDSAAARAQWDLTRATEGLSIQVRFAADQVLPRGIVPEAAPFPTFVAVQWALRTVLHHAALLVVGASQLDQMVAAGRVQLSPADEAALIHGTEYAARRLQEEAGRVVRLMQGGSGGDPRQANSPLPPPPSLN